MKSQCDWIRRVVLERLDLVHLDTNRRRHCRELVNVELSRCSRWERSALVKRKLAAVVHYDVLRVLELLMLCS